MAKIMVKLEKSTHYYVMALNAFIYFFSTLASLNFGFAMILVGQVSGPNQLGPMSRF